jgi:1-acyl-sn-glycerol-3-phosphate acyltransferase
VAVGTLRRVAIVAAYAVVFWLILPWGLLQLAGRLDRAAGWQPHAFPAAGWPLLVGGAFLLGAGMLELWRGGGGLPVGAMPPPRFTRRGPYRWARHPIYLGFNLGLLGAGLLLGSPALTWVVAPLFLPVWIGYALLEERALLRRFGAAYARYRRQVGLVPRFGLYRLSQLAMWLRVLRWRAEGRGHVPASGPVVLVFNHATFFDPAYLGASLLRPIHFLTTAEAYRSPSLGWLVRRYVNIPLRRYRQDIIACREMLRVLGEGRIIGMAVEGERSVWGRYQGCLPDVAGIVARLGVTVVPVGISGSYDAGPRWASRNRRRPVRIRFGPPLVFDDRPPVQVIDQGIRALLDRDPQPVQLGEAERQRIDRVLWRCPSCWSEAGWVPDELACEACGFRAEPLPEGLLRLPDGSHVTLADLGERVLAAPETAALTFQAGIWHEPDWFGPIRALRFCGSGEVAVGPAGIRAAALSLPLDQLSTVSTERSDTLQVTTRAGMWQIRPVAMSVFRLQAALDCWRTAAV